MFSNVLLNQENLKRWGENGQKSFTKVPYSRNKEKINFEGIDYI